MLLKQDSKSNESKFVVYSLAMGKVYCYCKLFSLSLSILHCSLMYFIGMGEQNSVLPTRHPLKFYHRHLIRLYMLSPHLSAAASVAAPTSGLFKLNTHYVSSPQRGGGATGGGRGV
jgi:hypothetical protein